MKRKLILSAVLTLSAIVLVVATVLTTVAFLAHQASVTNTFTMGNVMIHLYESAVDSNGKISQTYPEGTMKDSIGNSYQLSPNGSYDKDPTVYVMPNSDESILFVQVQNGIRNVEAAEEDGYIRMENQMVAKGWRYIGKNALGNVYVYDGTFVGETYPTDDTKYGAVIPTNDKMQSFDLFTNFKIQENASREAVEGKTLIVNAYAIQKKSFAPDNQNYLTKDEVINAWKALVSNFDTALELVQEENN